MKFEKLTYESKRHPLNKFFIFVIKEELKLDKSTDIIFATFVSIEESNKLCNIR